MKLKLSKINTSLFTTFSLEPIDIGFVSLFLGLGSRLSGLSSSFRSLNCLNFGCISLLFVRFDQLSLTLGFLNLLFQLFSFFLLLYDLEAFSQFFCLGCCSGCRRNSWFHNRLRSRLRSLLFLDTSFDGRSNSSIRLNLLFLLFSLFVISDSLFFFSAFNCLIGFKLGSLCSLSQLIIYFRVSSFL